MVQKQDVVLGAGAHIRVIGKGRKERCTPLTKQTVSVLKAWMSETARADTQVLFPNARGERLSSDGAQYLLSKHITVAREQCASLKAKHVTLHSFRHYAVCSIIDTPVRCHCFKLA